MWLLRLYDQKGSLAAAGCIEEDLQHPDSPVAQMVLPGLTRVARDLLTAGLRMNGADWLELTRTERVAFVAAGRRRDIDMAQLIAKGVLDGPTAIESIVDETVEEDLADEDLAQSMKGVTRGGAV